jgi:hypothetical protein
MSDVWVLYQNLMGSRKIISEDALVRISRGSVGNAVMLLLRAAMRFLWRFGFFRFLANWEAESL